MERFKMTGVEPEKKKGEEGITRRGFLKKASVAIGATLLGKGAYELMKDSKPIEIDEMEGKKLVEKARERAEKLDAENRAIREHNEENEYEPYRTYENWLRHHREENEEKKKKAWEYFEEEQLEKNK